MRRPIVSFALAIMNVLSTASARALLGVALLFLSQPHSTHGQSTTRNFNGIWIYHRNGYTFTLELVERGDSLVGTHCAVTRNAARVDCGIEDDYTARPISIRGALGKSTIHVRFQSFYSAATGEARLVHRGDRLVWSIVTGSVTDGEFFLPMNAVLRKSGNRRR